MGESTVRRRRALASSGGVFTLGLAGCLGGGDGAAGDDENQTETNNSDDTGGNTTDSGSDHGNHDHSSNHKVGQPASSIDVEMVTNDTGKHFKPHVVHVEKGGTVTWMRKSGAHDTNAYHPDEIGGQQRIPDEATPWGSEMLSDAGDTFERQFDVEGVYDYVCTPHEGEGMVGTVVVGWPRPDGQPGLKPPADDRPDAATTQLEKFNEQVRAVLASGEGGNSSDGGNSSEDGDGHDHDHDH